MDTARIDEVLNGMGRLAQEAARELAGAGTEQKNRALTNMAALLRQRSGHILQENAQDLDEARSGGLSNAMLDRLALDKERIEGMARGLEEIAALPDPIGTASGGWRAEGGIEITRVRVPLGVIGIIYESRPNVTADAAALCLKSGNACVLRGGSEAVNSNSAIAKLFRQALHENGLPADAVCFIEDTAREGVGAMLQSPDLIDVIIPRGGKSLVARIAAEARVPVIKHLDGICHVYLDEFADPDKAVSIAFNAKTSRYGTCNTMETLLVHAARAAELLPPLAEKYREKGVELRGCPQTLSILPDIQTASDQDWDTEYLAPVLAVKIVGSLEEAVAHINRHGSGHTDSIVTEHLGRARTFLRAVDSASVMVNASTRFADGFEYGLGAEIGISTDKIHVRGPVGLHGLTSQKWIVLGNGQIRT